MHFKNQVFYHNSVSLITKMKIEHIDSFIRV